MGNDINGQVEIDTIVIGSGIGGMAAAHDLAQSGQKVLVLEANDYIGGRLKSIPVKLHDNQVFNFEQGANWIHGNSGKNPIIQLSKKIEGLKYIETDDEDTSIYDENGKQVDEKVDKQWDQYEKIIDKLDKYEGVSVYDAIRKINPSKIENKFFMYHAANDIEFQTSGTLEDLSAEWGQDDEAFDGEDYLIVSRYQAFAEHLSKHQTLRVLLNRKVVEVRSNGQNSSSVICQNGDVFHAKKIIIAVPLGVLKSKSIKFVPELPHWKLQGIKKLEMGNVCKILIVPNKKIKVEDKEQYIGVVANDVDKRGAATYFLNIQSLAKLPALMTFGLGPNSDELENMPTAQLKQLITKRLRIFVNGIHENDFDILRSSWRSNPNFGGAYTYAPVDSSSKDWQFMAKPVFSNGWYFCGEHTHSKYRGTVHGAYMSGISVAKDIQNHANEQKWKYAGKS